MAYFEFPHTRNYEGDLGYIIKMLTELTLKYNDFFQYNSIKFADPLQWDITKQYEAYTIVFDYDSGYSYISKRPIPAGVNITNPDYWCLVGPLIIDAQARASIETILRFIANHYDSGSTATAVRNVGEYVVANGQLYKVTQLINIGEGYTEGYNVTSTTVEQMINDQFPIWSDKIANGAVTTPKLADGSVTGAKIAQHTIYKEDLAADKYLFIGDSFNADYHHSWGEKIIARLGLTLGQNVWNVAVPGGGIANGYILTGLQTAVADMSSSDKNTVTKILMCFGANDWGRTVGEITPGAINLENYLVSTFPNAEIIFVAAQWGYLNDTYRGGLLQAYNTYMSTWNKIKTIDKAFLMMMDPAFVEQDMVHPTDSCTTNLATLFINILNGGSAWNKYYTNLHALIKTDPYGGSVNFNLYGDITEAGTHIYRNTPDGIAFPNKITITHAGTQIGIIDASNDAGANNLFQRNAVIPIQSFIRYYNNADSQTEFALFNGRLIITKQENAHKWDVFLASDIFLDGANYNIDLESIYLTMDNLLDYTKT